MQYSHVGKQVLWNGQHYADAATVEIAAEIVDALNREPPLRRAMATALDHIDALLLYTTSYIDDDHALDAYAFLRATGRIPRHHDGVTESLTQGRFVRGLSDLRDAGLTRG